MPYIHQNEPPFQENLMISLSIQGDAGGRRKAVFRSVRDQADLSHAT